MARSEPAEAVSMDYEAAGNSTQGPDRYETDPEKTGDVDMNLKKIVAEWLVENGYEGLYREICGCKVDDLMPCDEPGPDCKPGHIVPCPGPATCEAGGCCEWHIGEK